MEPVIAPVNAAQLAGFDREIGHVGIKMHHAAERFDGLPQTADNAGEFIGANVGMGIDEDVRMGTVLDQPAEDFVDVASLVRAGVKLAVRVGAGAAFAKAVVGMGIDDAELLNVSERFSAGADILTALENDRAQPQLNEFQGGKIPRRTRTYNDHLGRVEYRAQIRLELTRQRQWLIRNANAELHHHAPAARIDRASLDPEVKVPDLFGR